MKRIIILLSLTLLACSNPVTFTEPDEQSQLIGTWERGGKAFTFYDNGDFSYFSMIDGEEYNYGYWVEYEDDGLLYLEDPLNFVYVWYDYFVDGSLWLDGGGGFVEWVMVE